MRRGRPKHQRERQDRGTPELQAKRRAGLTAEPLDRLLENGRITPEIHRSALHFRWLYTIARGLPASSTLARMEASGRTRQDSPAWREAREREYRQVALAYDNPHDWQITLEICVFQEVTADDGNCVHALLRLHETLQKTLKKAPGFP